MCRLLGDNALYKMATSKFHAPLCHPLPSSETSLGPIPSACLSLSACREGWNWCDCKCWNHLWNFREIATRKRRFEEQVAYGQCLHVRSRRTASTTFSNIKSPSTAVFSAKLCRVGMRSIKCKVGFLMLFVPHVALTAASRVSWDCGTRSTLVLFIARKKPTS